MRRGEAEPGPERPAAEGGKSGKQCTTTNETATTRHTKIRLDLDLLQIGDLLLYRCAGLDQTG